MFARPCDTLLSRHTSQRLRTRDRSEEEEKQLPDRSNKGKKMEETGGAFSATLGGYQGFKWVLALLDLPL